MSSRLVNPNSKDSGDLIKRKYWIREIIIRLVLGIILLCVCLFLRPFIRKVQPEMWHLYRFPYNADETFPPVQTAIILITLPLINLGYVLWALGRKINLKKKKRTSILYGLAISLALLLACLICEVVKRLYGRPRPDFLSRCFGTTDPEKLIRISASFKTDNPPDCSNSKHSWHVIENGRMSFPSEHSATAMSVFTVMGLWTFSQMKRMPDHGVEVVVIPLLLMILPLVIAISRTSDYRHHATDVVAGILLGCLVGVASCLFYFPRKKIPSAPSAFDFKVSMDALDHQSVGVMATEGV